VCNGGIILETHTAGIQEKILAYVIKVIIAVLMNIAIKILIAKFLVSLDTVE